MFNGLRDLSWVEFNYFRGKLDEAIEKLQKVEDLSNSSVGVRSKHLML